MTIRELVSKFRGAYRIEQESTTYGDTTHVRTTLIFTGDNLPPEIKRDYDKIKGDYYQHLIQTGSYRMGDNISENIFLQVLLGRGLLKKNEIEDFRQRMIRSHSNRLELKTFAIGALLFIIGSAIFIGIAIAING